MRILTFAISALLTVVLGTGAEAHAFLDHAEPRVGSTVATAPRALSLSFTQKLEPAFSSVEVTDANGMRVDLGKPSISSQRHACRIEAIITGNLQGPLARSVG